MTEKKSITDPLTEPLTERRGDMADYIIGGVEAPFIDAISQRVPIVGQNQIVRGIGQIAVGFALSQVKSGGSGSITKHIKTGTEIGFATTGSGNLVSGIANYVGKSKAPATTNTYGDW